MATMIQDEFETIDARRLATMDAAERDQLPFGVIGFERDTVARIYNATESRLAGLKPERVIGQPFFDAIAQCMNNYLVAQRFEDEPALDEVIPYVLTLRMRPTAVRMRLLAQPDCALRFILIER